jgi:hypothetical protein
VRQSLQFVHHDDGAPPRRQQIERSPDERARDECVLEVDWCHGVR